MTEETQVRVHLTADFRVGPDALVSLNGVDIPASRIPAGGAQVLNDGQGRTYLQLRVFVDSADVILTDGSRLTVPEAGPVRIDRGN